MSVSREGREVLTTWKPALQDLRPPFYNKPQPKLNYEEVRNERTLERIVAEAAKNGAKSGRLVHLCRVKSA
jgi:hypothetical protein